MSPDRHVLSEAGGWLTGLGGFVIVMYGVAYATSGNPSVETVAVTGGLLIAGLLVSLIGVTLAMTSREHRGKGHTGNQMPDDVPDSSE